MKAIISPNLRLRHPELFTVADDSIIDDFCYFSTRIEIGRSSHVASGCSVAGGRERLFRLGDFSSLSSGVKIWCTSDNFAEDLVTIIPPGAGPIKTALIEGDVVVGSYAAVGSNSVIMPRNIVPEGTVIGALSFVPAGFKMEPWSVYAGIPVRRRGPRNKVSVMKQADTLRRFLDSHSQRG